MAAIERRRRTAVEDAVAVAAVRRREAGMETLRHDFDLRYHDRIGLEVIVERAAHGLDRPFAAKVEMRDLAQGMDAGIGTAGALRHGALAAEGEHRVFERGLHRGSGVLALPADEGTAIVFDGEL